MKIIERASASCILHLASSAFGKSEKIKTKELFSTLYALQQKSELHALYTLQFQEPEVRRSFGGVLLAAWLETAFLVPEAEPPFKKTNSKTA